MTHLKRITTGLFFDRRNWNVRLFVGTWRSESFRSCQCRVLKRGGEWVFFFYTFLRSTRRLLPFPVSFYSSHRSWISRILLDLQGQWRESSSVLYRYVEVTRTRVSHDSQDFSEFYVCLPRVLPMVQHSERVFQGGKSEWHPHAETFARVAAAARLMQKARPFVRIKVHCVIAKSIYRLLQ